MTMDSGVQRTTTTEGAENGDVALSRNDLCEPHKLGSLMVASGRELPSNSGP